MDYLVWSLCPKIEKAFHDRKDLWIEDHVAYATLTEKYRKAHTAGFRASGYKREDDYNFKEKKLDAFWMSPDDISGHSEDASAKIFISELIPDSFSDAFQSVLKGAAEEVRVSPLPGLKALAERVKAGDEGAADGFVQSASLLLTSGPSWSRPDYKSYETLKSESDYAAWTYLFGHQINHFTVSVHLMSSTQDIAKLGEYLESDLGIPMNKSGGLVKGTADILWSRSRPWLQSTIH